MKTPKTKIGSDRTHGSHRRGAAVLIHVLSVFLLFMLPEFIMSLGTYDSDMNLHVRWGMYIKSAVYVAVFYVNYFLIIDRTLVIEGRRWRFAVYNALLIILALVLIGIICDAFWRPHSRGHHQVPERLIYARRISIALRDLVMLVLTIALSVAVRLSDRWRKLEHRQREMAAARREEELRGLKDQLNPHFLFNTLNTIYALIEVDAPEAQRCVHRLSAMLRHILYDENEMSDLAREIDFIRNYVELMRERMSRTDVRLNISTDMYNGRQVPSLIFLTLVENALKYGNTGRDDSMIEISLCADTEGITFTTRNRFDPASKRSADSGGIGLANLQRRLQLIYDNSARMRYGRVGASDVFEAELWVPYVNK